VVQDWWCSAGTGPNDRRDCWYDRAFAYPHAFNTFFGMYKIAHLYPGLVQYHNSADTYLMRAYNIVNALYSGHGEPGTGYMGEATLSEIRQALADAGHATEAERVKAIITSIYDAFSKSKYPYGSEYSFDNTGEEAVYLSARENGNTRLDGEDQRQVAGLPRGAADLVPLREPGHAERRGVVELSVRDVAHRLGSR